MKYSLFRKSTKKNEKLFIQKIIPTDDFVQIGNIRLKKYPDTSYSNKEKKNEKLFIQKLKKKKKKISEYLLLFKQKKKKMKNFSFRNSKKNIRILATIQTKKKNEIVFIQKVNKKK